MTEMMKENRTDGAEERSTEAMEQEWIMKGKEAYAKMDWKECLDSYAEAIKLNPASEAAELRKMAMSIIEFYCKDRYNP